MNDPISDTNIFQKILNWKPNQCHLVDIKKGEAKKSELSSAFQLGYRVT